MALEIKDVAHVQFPSFDICSGFYSAYKLEELKKCGFESEQDYRRLKFKGKNCTTSFEFHDNVSRRFLSDLS